MTNRYSEPCQCDRLVEWAKTFLPRISQTSKRPGILVWSIRRIPYLRLSMTVMTGPDKIEYKNRSVMPWRYSNSCRDMRV